MREGAEGQEWRGFHGARQAGKRCAPFPIANERKTRYAWAPFAGDIADMIARMSLTGAAVTVIFAVACPAGLFADSLAVPAPMMLGRWVVAPSDAAPSGDELKRLCTNPGEYLQITPPAILRVTLGAQVSCDMPVWTKVSAMRFEARLGTCTPAVTEGDAHVSVEMKGMAQMIYNDVPYAMCPTGP